MSTILIKNARMRGHQELTDLYIKDGVFAEIGGGLSYPADEIIDVAGKLVSAPFCDAHLHLDAVLSVGKPRYNMSGTLIEGINIWGERMQGLTKETIKKNARDVIKWEVANGSMFLRTHADATEPTGTVVEALLEVREEMKNLVDLQIVAFPQECIFTEKGHTDLMENAMKIAQARLSVATLDQVGAAALYSVEPSYFEATREEYQRRRDVCYRKLMEIPGVVTTEPKGAFYTMAKLPVDNAEDFQMYLLKEFSDHNETVMFAPGSGFYATEGAGLSEIRIAYVRCAEELERALDLLRIAIERYNSK